MGRDGHIYRCGCHSPRYTRLCCPSDGPLILTRLGQAWKKCCRLRLFSLGAGAGRSGKGRSWTWRSARTPQPDVAAGDAALELRASADMEVFSSVHAQLGPLELLRVVVMLVWPAQVVGGSGLPRVALGGYLCITLTHKRTVADGQKYICQHGGTLVM